MREDTGVTDAGRMLAVNQSSAALFRSLIKGVSASGTSVVLLTGWLEPDGGRPPEFTFIPACRLQKAPAWKRIWTWGVFTFQAIRAMVKYRDRMALLVTNPPLVPWVAPLMRRLFGVRYSILVYDIYPDILTRMRMLKPAGWVDRWLRRLSGRSLRNAECVFTLGDCMKKTLQAHLRRGEKVNIHVIPNWADVHLLVPMPKASNPFAAAHDLTNKFVVMYSGAFGATHDIDSIVEAAKRLSDMPDVQFVLIGGGTREAEIRQRVTSEALSNLTFLRWQPSDQVKYSLTAADCHIVCLDTGYEGISIPSKTYTSLAAGAAILAVSPPDTELTRIVDRHDCGVWVRPRDADSLAAAVRGLYEDPGRLARLKANSRRAAVEHYSTERCVEQYLQVLLPLLD